MNKPKKHLEKACIRTLRIPEEQFKLPLSLRFVHPVRQYDIVLVSTLGSLAVGVTRFFLA